jgi:hypothetical protein
MPNETLMSFSDLPCCPEITRDPCCDRLQFTYRLENRMTDLPVEIVITAELERCPGPLSLGDVVYSTTLLPGEKVHLYTSSRNTRFTYDSESQVTYRHEQVSEETYYMTSMDRFMSDLTVNESGGGSSQSSSEFKTEGSVSNWTDAIFGRPDARVEGNFSAESSYDFMRELRRHAESSHERTVQGTRAASSVAVGEVQTRNHAEGETESAFEASTRILENRNECSAVTYLFYQLVKKQTVRFRIKSVLRRVRDPAGDAGVSTRPLKPNSNVAVIPNGILATDLKRVEVETSARTAAASDKANVISGVGVGAAALAGLSTVNLAAAQFRTLERTARPVTPEARAAALKAVDTSLVKAGILDRVGGEVSPSFAAELSFERTSCLPTQAIVVKACLDICNACDESRQRSIKLDLERKALENKLLERQIELLEKSQEYRCCPVGEAEEEED